MNYNKIKFKIIFLAATLLLVNAQTVHSASISINSNHIRQKIEGHGGPYRSIWYDQPGYEDAVAKFTINNLKPTILCRLIFR